MRYDLIFMLDWKFGLGLGELDFLFVSFYGFFLSFFTS